MVTKIDPLVELFGQSIGELSSLVRDQLQGETISAYPAVEDGGGDSNSFFIGNPHQFNIFGEGVGDAQHVLFAIFGSEWSEKICVDALVVFCALR